MSIDSNFNAVPGVVCKCKYFAYVSYFQMAILRYNENLDNTVNYVATLAFFCAISCVTIMLKFGGFKASLNIFNSRKNGKEKTELHQGSYMTGAYRTNRDDVSGYVSTPSPTKTLSPAMVKLPGRKPCCLLTTRPTKSLGNLTLATSSTTKAVPNQNTTDVSTDPRGEGDREIKNPSHKQREKERKRLEKQRLDEQKAIERTTREQAKVEKIKREKEKKRVEEGKIKDKKRKAPQPQQQSVPSLGHGSAKYSINTLDSSISRSTGPPPYSETATELVTLDASDATRDVSFGKPIDTGTWDIVAEHREQLNRTTHAVDKNNKQTVIDLNYSAGSDDKTNNDM
ncbi:uncharacterized protein LOC114241771 isoform X1 [Bombyx mandarina]|uniref:Uncharacterized protein LOC114241771 isoform X1 n=2 Tax=Bombyx mandarina TaxID=7092 RepID=A0A6J2JG32_BOMMA|nr:uncharacterized protein LOC114241771 isoform X1 [Bombyx mandarina]